MDLLTSLLDSYSWQQWSVLFACAFLIGMGKAGIKGLGMFVVPLMAATFGGKPSVGLVLPMLSMADVFAVNYYSRHAEWIYIKRLLPAAVLGVGVAIVVGQLVADSSFTGLIAVIIIGSLALLLLQENASFSRMLSGHWLGGAVFGAMGGFATMIGNAAGPIMAVYLLSTRIPKNAFIGTAAWFFLLINLFKIPFHIWVWQTINWHSFLADLIALPAILLGVFTGIRLVRLIPETAFRYFVIGITFIICIKILWGLSA